MDMLVIRLFIGDKIFGDTLLEIRTGYGYVAKDLMLDPVPPLNELGELINKTCITLDSPPPPELGQECMHGSINLPAEIDTGDGIGN